MSSAESSTSEVESTQRSKDEIRVKFTAKFDEWLQNKKDPNIKSDKKYNEIGTRTGELPNWYSRNQLEPITESFMTDSDVPDSTLPSFRSAVAKDSVTGGQGVVHCNCAGKCDRCSCKKKGLQCNSRRHKSNSTCSNK